MAKNFRPSLEDIARSIRWIEADTKAADFDYFRRSRQLRQVVERNIEIISEASRRIPEKLKAKYPDIPWREIAGIGNVMRHDYDEVAPTLVWNVVRHHLKPLKKVVRSMLADMTD